MNKKDIKRSFLPYVFLVLLLIGIYYMAVVGNQTVNKITYDKFLDELNINMNTGVARNTNLNITYPVIVRHSAPSFAGF